MCDFKTENKLQWSWKHHKNHWNHGRVLVFTLIELMVVISIIAILASLLLPALNKAKHNTHRIACLNNLKQLGISIEIYCGDFNNFYPKTYEFCYGDSNIRANWTSTAESPLCPLSAYAGTTGRFQCPSDTIDRDYNVVGITPCSYAFSSVVNGSMVPTNGTTLMPSTDINYHMSRIWVAKAKRGAAQYLVGGEYWQSSNYLARRRYGVTQVRAISTLNAWYSCKKLNGSYFYNLHGRNSGNYVWADGHASSEKHSDLLQAQLIGGASSVYYSYYFNYLRK